MTSHAEPSRPAAMIRWHDEEPRAHDDDSDNDSQSSYSVCSTPDPNDTSDEAKEKRRYQEELDEAEIQRQERRKRESQWWECMRRWMEPTERQKRPRLDFERHGRIELKSHGMFVEIPHQVISVNSDESCPGQGDWRGVRREESGWHECSWEARERCKVVMSPSVDAYGKSKNERQEQRTHQSQTGRDEEQSANLSLGVVGNQGPPPESFGFSLMKRYKLHKGEWREFAWIKMRCALSDVFLFQCEACASYLVCPQHGKGKGKFSYVYHHLDQSSSVCLPAFRN